MPNKKIDRLVAKSDCSENEIVVLDMGQYIHQKDENNIHSVGGKIFNNNTIRTSNSCKPIPRYMNLNKELMYLYGWVQSWGA